MKVSVAVKTTYTYKSGRCELVVNKDGARLTADDGPSRSVHHLHLCEDDIPALIEVLEAWKNQE